MDFYSLLTAPSASRHLSHVHPFTHTCNVAVQLRFSILLEDALTCSQGIEPATSRLPNDPLSFSILVTLTCSVMELIDNRSSHLWICRHVTSVIISHIFILICTYSNTLPCMSDWFSPQLSIRNEILLFSEISTWIHSRATVFVTIFSVPSGCLPFSSLSHNAFVHTQVYCADSSQYRHMTRMLKSQNLAQCVIYGTAGWRYCLSQWALLFSDLFR